MGPVQRCRGLSSLLSLIPAGLLLCGCAGGDTARTPAAGAAPTAAAPAGSYAAMLAGHGIAIAIPPRGKFIMVNIPSFELIALQDGVPVLRSRVVVGRPATPTPELQSAMFAVTFNPSWTPTPAMVRYEGARFAPPGPNNPLGQILFELDNDALIFLHDTNDRKYFELAQRDLSHGCIRVQQARGLAAWALGVSQGEIDALVAARATRSVPLPQQVPVSLVYYTAFPDADGNVVTYPDIYTRSRAADQGRTLAVAPSPPPCAAPLGAPGPSG